MTTWATTYLVKDAIANRAARRALLRASQSGQTIPMGRHGAAIEPFTSPAEAQLRLLNALSLKGGYLKPTSVKGLMKKIQGKGEAAARGVADWVTPLSHPEIDDRTIW